MSSQTHFKVIIAGGSVAGLTLANALERAGVDFVLLEKRDIAPNVGQTIFVLPCSSLVMEQLDIAQTLEQNAIPIKTREHWDANMNLFCTSDELWLLYQQAQRPARFVDRFRFLKSLYGGIKDKSKLREREGIISFIETDAGVTVRTDKDNLYEGSILVGADGVHSEVRKQIATKLEKRGELKASHALSRGFQTRYACLTALSQNHFVNDEKRPFLADGVLNNSYHDEERIGGISAAGTPGQLIWSVYIPLECLRRSSYPEYPSPKFTQEDIDRFIEEYGHLKFCPDYAINDVYKTVIGASLISMEENVLPAPWNSGGRAVLIGDAVHKATANLGMGGNLCIDDVCRLVNGLLPLLNESGGTPSTQALAKLFDDYEKAGRGRASFVCNASAFFCGFETSTAWYANLVKMVFPWIPSSLKMRVFSIFDGAAPKMDFLPVPTAKFDG